MVKKINGNVILATLASAFFASAMVIHSRSEAPTIRVEKQESAVNINRDFLKLVSLGNKRLISDIIWIQTLLESDETHYEGKDLNSWMYHRFRTIAELDHRFYENYLWGGMFLSIVKDDVEGAADIYERGLTQYPTDYKLNYNAGFNYYFEMGNFEKGLEKLRIIENYPQTPMPVRFVINKLRFETSGNYDTAMQFLLHNIENTADEGIKNKLRVDLYGLKAQRDLECLNKGDQNCDRTDSQGNPYVLTNGIWKSRYDFKPFKIFKRPDQEPQN